LWDVIDEVREGKFRGKEFEETKKGLLLSMSRAYETNRGKAGYYSEVHYEFEDSCGIVNDEERLKNVGPGDVAEVARRYFRRDRAVTIKSVPTLTYTQFYAGLIVGSLLAVGVVVYIYRRRRARRKRYDLGRLMKRR
jgi:predicted Zn-dependent peptidase